MIDGEQLEISTIIYQMPQADFMPDGLVLNETINKCKYCSHLSRALLLAKEKALYLI